jgi:hypothetical protein
MLYADRMTDSMRAAISLTERRRMLQIEYNKEHGIEPTTVMKNVADILGRLRSEHMPEPANKVHGISSLEDMLPDDLSLEIARVEKAMLVAASELRFEEAAACATCSTATASGHDFVTRRTGPRCLTGRFPTCPRPSGCRALASTTSRTSRSRYPRDQLVVFTGLSGSGKSSLAFDTIYAEGQRRYVESLSAYARQFLGQMDKPDVDFIEGLSPAISIDQKTASRNPRSTVGTITEIHDYLRLLFARVGVQHCPNCGKVVTRQTPQQIVDQVLARTNDERFLVLATVVAPERVSTARCSSELAAQGFSRARVDGVVIELA